MVAILEETFRYLEPFAPRVGALTGLTLDELRLAIVSLKNYLIDLCGGPGAYTCLSRGIVFSETQWLREKLRSNIEEASRKEGLQLEPQRVVERFLDLLACKRERLQGYDVFLRKGQGCFLEQNLLTLFDLTLILMVLVDRFQDLSIDDKMKTIKGSGFEKTVASSLKRDLPGIEFPIAPGLHLKREGEHDRYGQADVYVVVGQLLFIVDCKACAVTRRYLKGERSEVENRWKDVAQWIREIDVLAGKIARIRDPGNYRIPSGITHIIPVVCSAFAEFVWELDEKYWLRDRSVPRVCTYPELAAFFRECNVEEILHRAYAMPINH